MRFVQFKGIEEGLHEFDPAIGEVVVDEGVDAADVESTFNEVGRHFIGVAGGVAVLK